MITRGRRCRQCGGNSRVIDVRDGEAFTYRRRRCVECGYRWTTRERDEDTEPTGPPAADSPTHAVDRSGS